MPILPGQTACLRCLLPSPPPPGSVETCDTAGVLGPAVSVAAALQAALAIRILTGHSAEIGCQLTVLDVWNGTFRQVDTSQLQAAGTCPACHHGERLWLSGSQRAASTVLCGRNAVQITPPEPLRGTLSELAERLQAWQHDGRDVVFLVGGPDGLDPALKATADESLRLSDLTLPHAFVRVFLAEALYRAWSLRNGHPYHRE